MDTVFEYQSEKFTTQSKMKEEVAKLKESMCEHFGYNRNEIRLPHGLIMLRGYSKITECDLNLTSTIGEFKKYLKDDNYTDFYVMCRLQQTK